MTRTQKVALRIMSRQRRISSALELLNPPATERDECRARINKWLDDVEVTRRIAAVTQREKNQYSTTLKKLQSISRYNKGRFFLIQNAINRASIDLLVAVDKVEREGQTAFSARMGIEGPLPPLEPGYTAAAAAFELLYLRHHKRPGCKDSGDWHKLTQILYGDTTVNLYGWIRKVEAIRKWMQGREKHEQAGGKPEAKIVSCIP